MDCFTYIKAAIKFGNCRFAKLLYKGINRLWNTNNSLPSAVEADKILADFNSDNGVSSICPEKQLSKVSRDLTIIVAAYNMEKYIGECLDSILSQETRYDFLVRVVDDCSTDNTGNILQKYASDKRVEIIRHNKNMGWRQPEIRPSASWIQTI